MPLQASPPAGSVWAPEQTRRFLEHAKSHRLSAAFHLAAVTGMRPGEVLGLRWGDLDLETGTVTVRQSLVLVNYEPTISQPETAAGQRRFKIDSVTVAVLKDYRRQQRKSRMAWGEAWQDTGLVFAREEGSLVHPEAFSHAFVSLSKAAGLPLIRHDVRHTYATAALVAGVPVKVVSARLGHRSTAFTQGTYPHLLQEQDDDAAILVASVILGP